MKTRWNFNTWLSFLDSHIIDYPTPVSLNYNWSFGSAAGICLSIQILSGVFLAMHYTPHIDYAFSSVEHIIRDVKYGWILRYVHANGASFFFIVVYFHIFRGLYHGSYVRPRQGLWCSGLVIFILIIATAFLGYVLPWGQISFWGATVITNLFSAIPQIGKEIVRWLWGGFSVDNATLNRFFSLHYILPFLITGMVFIHLGLLHKDGSNNPLGAKTPTLSFYPYFYVKDLFAFFIILTLLIFVVCFLPNTIGHPDNYIPADPLKTPAHIVPEWYFLPFYAILRSIPDKLGGVIGIGGSLIGLIILPFLHTGKTRSATFRPIYKIGFWLWLGTFLVLGWIGQIPVSGPYVVIGQIATVLYFVVLLIGVSLVGVFENFFAAASNSNTLKPSNTNYLVLTPTQIVANVQHTVETYDLLNPGAGATAEANITAAQAAAWAAEEGAAAAVFEQAVLEVGYHTPEPSYYTSVPVDAIAANINHADIQAFALELANNLANHLA